MPTAPPTYRQLRRGGKKRTTSRGTDTRPSPSVRGYDRTWYDLRRRVIRDDPVKWLTCKHCGITVADPSRIHLDHITPLSQGGARLDVENLQPLCVACHSRKTKQERA